MTRPHAGQMNPVRIPIAGILPREKKLRFASGAAYARGTCVVPLPSQLPSVASMSLMGCIALLQSGHSGTCSLIASLQIRDEPDHTPADDVQESGVDTSALRAGVVRSRRVAPAQNQRSGTDSLIRGGRARQRS